MNNSALYAGMITEINSATALLVCLHDERFGLRLVAKQPARLIGSETLLDFVHVRELQVRRYGIEFCPGRIQLRADARIVHVQTVRVEAEELDNARDSLCLHVARNIAFKDILVDYLAPTNAVAREQRAPQKQF